MANNNNGPLSKKLRTDSPFSDLSTIYESFRENYASNLKKFTPPITARILERINDNNNNNSNHNSSHNSNRNSNHNNNRKKLLNNLKDTTKNFEFREKIYLNYVSKFLDNQKKLKKSSDSYYFKLDKSPEQIATSIKTAINKVVENPIQIDKKNLNINFSVSHGNPTTELFNIPDNVFVIVINPLNRMVYTNETVIPFRNISNKIIQELNNPTINDINPYEIMKNLYKLKCFYDSSIFFPNQTMYDITLSYSKEENEASKEKRRIGLYNYSLNNPSQYNNFAIHTPDFLTPLSNGSREEKLSSFIGKKSNDKTKYDIFLVFGCNMYNLKNLEEYELNYYYLVEKIYIYYNFAKILNSTILNNLISKSLIFDFKSIDCKIRFSDKDTKFNRNNENGLLANSSLSPITNLENKIYYLLIQEKYEELYKFINFNKISEEDLVNYLIIPIENIITQNINLKFLQEKYIENLCTFIIKILNTAGNNTIFMDNPKYNEQLLILLINGLYNKPTIPDIPDSIPNREIHIERFTTIFKMNKSIYDSILIKLYDSIIQNKNIYRNESDEIINNLYVNMINSSIDCIINNFKNIETKLNTTINIPESFIKLINFPIDLSEKNIICIKKEPINNVHDVLKIIHINDNKKCAGEQLFDIYNKINSNFPDFFNNTNNNTNNNNTRGPIRRTKRKGNNNLSNKRETKKSKKK
jgi:hypothetical protein